MGHPAGDDPNRIHPTAVVGANVRLGRGNVVGPFAVLVGDLTIGDDNWIGPGVILGGTPEVAALEHGEPWNAAAGGTGAVVVGSNNTFHEYATVSSGWSDTTQVGNGCFVMAKAHVAHDCLLMDGVALSAGVVLGGHVELWERSTLGMGSCVHQRRRVGPGAMVGMGAVVTRDVDAFALAVGNPARRTGLNRVGLSRMGVDLRHLAAVEELLDGSTSVADVVPSTVVELARQWRLAPTGGQHNG